MCVSCSEMKLEEGRYVCLKSSKEIVSTEDSNLVLKKLYQKPIWCEK